MTKFLLDTPAAQKFGIVTGSTGTAGVATASFTALSCQMVMFQAGTSNSGSATYTDSSGSLTQGITLTAGAMSPWIPCQDMADFYYIMSSTVDTIKWHAIL